MLECGEHLLVALLVHEPFIAGEHRLVRHRRLALVRRRAGERSGEVHGKLLARAAVATAQITRHVVEAFGEHIVDVGVSREVCGGHGVDLLLRERLEIQARQRLVKRRARFQHGAQISARCRARHRLCALGARTTANRFPAHRIRLGIRCVLACCICLRARCRDRRRNRRRCSVRTAAQRLAHALARLAHLQPLSFLSPSLRTARLAGEGGRNGGAQCEGVGGRLQPRPPTSKRQTPHTPRTAAVPKASRNPVPTSHMSARRQMPPTTAHTSVA